MTADRFSRLAAALERAAEAAAVQFVARPGEPPETLRARFVALLRTSLRDS